MTTSIKWQGATLPGLTEATQTERSGGVFSGVPRQGSRNGQRSGVLETALDRALRRLEARIGELSWPDSWQSFPATRLASTTASAADLSVTLAARDAAPGSHSVRVDTRAQATLYQSAGFDPDAPTTLAPGTYTLAWAVGSGGSGGSGEAELVVNSGDTWADVLSRMARVFGSASPALVSRLTPAKRVWDSADGEDRRLVDAVGIAIGSAESGSAGRLSLSGADAASSALLKALGLDATAQPGTDGRAVVDGVAQTSATGLFTADSGRVLLQATGGFGETEQVRVSGAAETLADGLAGVLVAYNEVQGLLKGGTLVKAGQAEDWAAPVRERVSELAGLGVRESAGGALWLDGERFLAALFAAPERVRSVLAGEDGLLPELSAKARGALASGAQSLLEPEATGLAADPVLKVFAARREGEAGRERQLLNLYDAVEGEENANDDGRIEQAGWTGVLHVKG